MSGVTPHHLAINHQGDMLAQDDTRTLMLRMRRSCAGRD